MAHPELAGDPRPRLDRDATADVVVVGGGYTGMWSAFFLTERRPDLDVVLLDRDVCGGGPSGRNGGFLNAFYDEAGLLESRFGDEGRRTVEVAARSIGEIGAWCERHDVDAWYAPTGHLAISTSPGQDRVVEETLDHARRLGLDEIYRELDPSEVRARFDSPVARRGIDVVHAALVQPARLARGLRRVLLERRVRIFEDTTVSRLRNGSPVIAETPGGDVRAGAAIVGVNAWATAWREFRRRIMIRGTYIVITAPAPDLLERMRWTGGEGVYDFRTALHYLRLTPDGRIAFGGAGLAVAPKRVTARYDYDERSVRDLVRDFRRWFPGLRDVPVEAAWGGPVDVSAWHLPFFGTMPGGTTHYGLGFTGNGVGPCHLGGKILSGLALGIEDETTTLPIARAEPRRFPPEPLFTLGERLVTRAILRKDALEDRGSRPDPVTNALAHLPRRLGYNLGP